MLNPYQSPVIVEGETAVGLSAAELILVLCAIVILALFAPLFYIAAAFLCPQEIRAEVVTLAGVASIAWLLGACFLLSMFI